MTRPRFPQLTTCRYCEGILSRGRAEDPWTIYGLAGTTSIECPKAPNPEDGPMPPHVPGTKILEPPILSDALTEPTPVVIPRIPRVTALSPIHVLDAPEGARCASHGSAYDSCEGGAEFRVMLDADVFGDSCDAHLADTVRGALDDSNSRLGGV